MRFFLGSNYSTRLENTIPRGNGRRPYDLESMLRIYFTQQWYQLSDPAMEDSLYDIESMRRFAKLSLDKIPDESTILGFRHVLEKHELTAKLFRVTEKHLSKHGLILSEGTIVDASIVSAPSSTKNKERERQSMVLWNEDAYRHRYPRPCS